MDGTLLSGGPAKHAFLLALEGVFGTAGPIHEWEFSGKTDPQIARELLREAGLDHHRIDAGLPEVWERYIAEMRSRLPECPTRPLPGTRALLERLDSLGTVALGLLTGNVVEGARLKLGSAGLSAWLSVGAFGSDDESRDRLPAIAIRRAEEHWRSRFPPGEVVVVGDTPLDVRCGRAHGTRTVAVATGRFDIGALTRTEPDAVLSSLAETDEALDAILG